jgi:hypothetical protein
MQRVWIDRDIEKKRVWVTPVGINILQSLLAVQHSVKTFQTNCELTTIPMLLTVDIPYSGNIKNKQNLKGGMTYV